MTQKKRPCDDSSNSVNAIMHIYRLLCRLFQQRIVAHQHGISSVNHGSHSCPISNETDLSTCTGRLMLWFFMFCGDVIVFSYLFLYFIICSCVYLCFAAQGHRTTFLLPCSRHSSLNSSHRYPWVNGRLGQISPSSSTAEWWKQGAKRNIWEAGEECSRWKMGKGWGQEWEGLGSSVLKERQCERENRGGFVVSGSIFYSHHLPLSHLKEQRTVCEGQTQKDFFDSFQDRHHTLGSAGLRPRRSKKNKARTFVLSLPVDREVGRRGFSREAIVAKCI